jgi:hypothetical protein
MLPCRESSHAKRRDTARTEGIGVAVTAYEDSLQAGAPPDEMSEAAAELDTRLKEIMVLIDRLRAEVTGSS